jgi:hypothetical protein
MNSLIISQTKLDQTIQVIDLTAEVNICKQDSNINKTLAYQELNSMFPDIISRSTKIYSAENEKNERPLPVESKCGNQDKDSSPKEFLSKKRKYCKINKSTKKSSNESTSLKSKDKNDYNNPRRRLARSNYAEALKNDESLQTLVNLVFSGQLNYIIKGIKCRKK